MAVRMKPIRNPDGLLIVANGFMDRSIVRERLATMALEYVEHRSLWSSQFVVTLPEGGNTGNIQAWLRARGRD